MTFLERKLGSSEEDIMDPVFGEIAEGGGIAFFSGEEVFIDAKDPWAGVVFHLREFVLKEVVITALDGGLSYRELFRERFLANAIPVFFEDLPSESFSGALVGKDTLEPVIEVLAAGLAEIFVGSELEECFSGAETFVSDPAVEGIFDP